MVSQALFSSKTENWATPQELFDKLNAKYRFTLDAAASKDNAKCVKYFSKEDDGLSQSWRGERVFVNPPYARGITGLWVKKCFDEYWEDRERIICALLPARTDTKWFHNYCLSGSGARIEFIKGRLKFGGATNGAPFPSILVFWGE